MFENVFQISWHGSAKLREGEAPAEPDGWEEGSAGASPSQVTDIRRNRNTL